MDKAKALVVFQETVTNCHALNMRAQDGKRRLTDDANTNESRRSNFH